MKLHAHWNLLSWIFFTFLLLIHTVSVQSVRVEGFIGESVTLPCSFGQKPQTVFWRNDDSRVVCDIIRGEADFSEQDPVYKDRVEISQSEIEKGNFSIMLSNVKESDSGQYTCIVPNSKTLTLELTVKEKPTTTERKNPTPLTDESPTRADGPLTFLLGCALLFNLTF
ncbi:CD276 antigen homolog isoform X2 [Ictalurus furcatus]|uniref:CD276 antigen homolog isoform X2 n=1 Tax=Ictalurus furcatus TaxID=66913 RepID=UPI00234FF98A|nr:CD276 antigen homolog isoform X2 [Ictalurus furcatus]